MRDLAKALFKTARTIARLDAAIAKVDEHGLVYLLVAYGTTAPTEGLIYGQLVGVPASARRGKVGFRFQGDVVGLSGALLSDGRSAHVQAAAMDGMLPDVKVVAMHRREWQQNVRATLIVTREVQLNEREKGGKANAPG